MPIVEVRALPQDPPIDVPTVLGNLCTGLADVLGCDPRQVWATWTTIPDGRYVEGVHDAAHQPPDTHPPLVRISLREGRTADQRRGLLLAAAKSLGTSLGIDPANVFVRLEELAPGTVHSGGRILE